MVAVKDSSITINTAPPSLSLPQNRWAATRGVVPSLDGFRAFSIIIVMVGHLGLPEAWIGVSALGLDIFYLVSGFLITRLLFLEASERGTVDLKLFYIRRLLRLYPVLVVFMVLVLAIQTYRGGPISLLEVSSVFLYFWNYLLPSQEAAGYFTPLPIGVFWSLSVEEHFYLVAPIVFFLVRGRVAAMTRFALALCIGCLALRYTYLAVWPGLEKTLIIYRHSETRADSIAFGVLLACLCQTEDGRRVIERLATRTAFVIGVCVLLSTYIYRDAYYQNTIRFTLQDLALLPIIVGAVFAQPFRWINVLLNAAPIRWIGRLSYSMYVWSSGVIFFFGWWTLKQPQAVSLLSPFVLILLMATASYYIVERPAFTLRSRFHAGKKPSTAPAAVIGLNPARQDGSTA